MRIDVRWNEGIKQKWEQIQFKRWLFKNLEQLRKNILQEYHLTNHRIMIQELIRNIGNRLC